MNEQELCVFMMIMMVWSKSRRRRRRQFLVWYQAFASAISRYDRAGRLFPSVSRRVSDWWSDDAQYMEELQFRDHFRINKSVFDVLVNDLSPCVAYNGLSAE